MRHIESEIEKIVYDEYGNILDAKDKKIEERDKKIEEYKKEYNQLSKLEDLSPEARKIINSLMLI